MLFNVKNVYQKGFDLSHLFFFSIKQHIKVKVSSYIAQYPIPRTAQSALQFTSVADLFISTSLGRIQPYAAINARRLLVHHCLYPFIYQIYISISNIFDTAGRRRAGIGSTHDARPMPRFLEITQPMPGRCPTTSHDDRPMQNRPADRPA